MVAVVFPEERELLRETELLDKETKLPKELLKEISVLYKLGLEEYEIKYLLSLKAKRESSLKWTDDI
jgi:hypothetical protein